MTVETSMNALVDYLNDARASIDMAQRIYDGSPVSPDFPGYRLQASDDGLHVYSDHKIIAIVALIDQNDQGSWTWEPWNN